MAVEHEQVVAALRSPEAYVHEGVAVVDVIEHAETHVSHLFFVGDFVYKLKKPVDVGFADFTTLEKRKANTERELRLNRRMSPDVYLDVLPVTADGAAVTIGGSGEVVDYVLKMRRLSHDRMLDGLLERDAVSEEDIRRVGRQVAVFHANAGRSEEITRRGGLDDLRRLVEENFAQTERYVGGLVDRRVFDDIVAFSRAWLEAKAPVLGRREADGKIRDGHGDLHAQHIWLDDRIEFIDCLEFNDDYRYGDVALDLAFLAMDLDRYGRPDLGAELIAAYQQFSKDTEIRELMPFYKCYRAYVRAKVASIRLENATLDAEERSAGEAEARRYYGLAHSYSMEALPERWLFVVMGLSGTGKSTLAKALGDHWGLPVVSSDVERKRLAGIALDDHTRSGDVERLYSDEMNERTYAVLYERAREELQRGSVVLDATFNQLEGREVAVEIASEAGAQAWLIECVAPEDVIRRRLDARAAAGSDPSDATWDVYVRQREGASPVGEVPGALRVVVDTDASPGEVLQRALQGVFGAVLG